MQWVGTWGKAAVAAMVTPAVVGGRKLCSWQIQPLLFVRLADKIFTLWGATRIAFDRGMGAYRCEGGYAALEMLVSGTGVKAGLPRHGSTSWRWAGNG